MPKGNPGAYKTKGKPTKKELTKSKSKVKKVKKKAK